MTTIPNFIKIWQTFWYFILGHKQMDGLTLSPHAAFCNTDFVSGAQ